ELGIFGFFGGGGSRLEGHTADGAGAGGGADDFRVHGAGVFDGGGRGVGIRAGGFGSELDWFEGRSRRRRGLGGQVFLGGGAEFLGAAGGAEVVGFAGVFDG